MGKATILSHLGNGLYSIAYHRDIRHAAARLTELEQLQIDLDSRLIDQYAALAQVENKFLLSSRELDWALDTWADCMAQVPACPEMSGLESQLMQVMEINAADALAVSSVKQAIAQTKAEKVSAYSEAAYLRNTAKETEVFSVWCADYLRTKVIPNMSEVGTIETFGANPDLQGGYLPKAYVNIRPSYEGSSSYSYKAGRDKCVVPLSAVGPATLAYDYAQWLYVMANNPYHAIGNLDSKDEQANTGTVTLWGKTPAGNQPDRYPFDGSNSVTLSNVPIVYENCHAKAFTVGDDVIVRFSGLGRYGPTVIGFASNPKACPQEPVAWRYNSGIYDPYVPTWTATGGTMMTHVWVGYSGLTCSFMGNAAGSAIQYDGGVATVTGFFVHGACIRDEVEGSPQNPTTVRYIYAIVSSTTAIKMVKLNAATFQSTDLWTVLYSTANESRILREAWFHPAADSFIEAVMPARRAISTTDISAIATMTTSGRTLTDYGSFKGGTNGSCSYTYIASSGGNSSTNSGSGMVVFTNYIETSNVLIHCRYHPDTGTLCTVTMGLKNGEWSDALPTGDWWCSDCDDYPGQGWWIYDSGQEWTLTWSVDGSTLTNSKAHRIEIDARNPYTCNIDDVNDTRTYLIHHLDPCYPQHTVYSRSGSRTIKVPVNPAVTYPDNAYMATTIKYDAYLSVAGQVVVEGATTSGPTNSNVIYEEWKSAICWDGCNPSQFPQTCTPTARSDPATIFENWPGAKLQVASYKDKFFALFDKPTVTSTGTFGWTEAVSTIISSEFSQSLFVTDTGQTVDHTKTIGAGITTQA